MRIYCSGIGGIGLSAYAAHMHAQGHDVYGSDKTDSPLLEDLRGQGMHITLNQDGSALPDDLDLLVYSEAIPETAPERVKARERGVRQISYFHGLGELTDGKNLISIAGTHGKSSTTAMTAKVLMDLGLDPNVVVGTKLKELGGRNWRKSKNDLWAVESCEYRKSFHYLSPRIILLTNADGDHFDAFESYEAYRQAFVDFLKKLPPDGVVIGHGNDSQVTDIVRAARKTMIDADSEPMVPLATPGKHMQHNAQLVLALARHLGMDTQKAKESLRTFGGTWRRMEVKGTTKDGITVIDDYAHHPKEIQATLNAMRDAYPKHRMVAVFQPHTHDRTLKLWDDFAMSFKDADVIVVSDIYDARPDKDAKKADLPAFIEAIGEGSGKEVIAGGSVIETETMLRKNILKPGDVLVVMGAGNITSLAQKMIQ